MQIEPKSKTITLTREDLPNAYFTKNIYNVRYTNVLPDVKIKVRIYFKIGYKVVYEHRDKKVLMIYNK